MVQGIAHWHQHKLLTSLQVTAPLPASIPHPAGWASAEEGHHAAGYKHLQCYKYDFILAPQCKPLDCLPVREAPEIDYPQEGRRRRQMDAYVDDLFDPVTDQGSPAQMTQQAADSVPTAGAGQRQEQQAEEGHEQRQRGAGESKKRHGAENRVPPPPPVKTKQEQLSSPGLTLTSLPGDPKSPQHEAEAALSEDLFGSPGCPTPPPPPPDSSPPPSKPRIYPAGYPRATVHGCPIS
ncbi:myosin XVB, partial [Lates japonicus]